MGNRICAVEDCEKNARSRGWCDKHYWRWQKYGSPTQVTLVYGDDDARFWAKVDKQENGCWLWTAGLFSTGYACFSINQTSLLAHRWAYARLVGPIPDDLTLDHLCREPRCVNPQHLEPVTSAENARRARAVKPLVAHCFRGHPYDEANTYRHGGRRYCRACRKHRKRAAGKAA